MAREMAAAAIGLRGAEASKAMTARRRELATQRWSAITSGVVRSQERSSERVKESLRLRVRAVLGQPDASSAACDQGESQGIDQGEASKRLATE